MDCDLPHVELPKVALEYLAESRYGFTLADMSLKQEDLNFFDLIDIRLDRDYNQVGELEELEYKLRIFFLEIGDNSEELREAVSSRILKIVDQIMKVSGRESAWVSLRSFVPKVTSKILIWHYDGGFYSPIGFDTLVYRFVITLKGAPTVFYLAARDDRILRQKLSINMSKSHYLNKICDPSLIFIPKRGEGVFFITQNQSSSALHAIPFIQEPRIFLSIIPCNLEELAELKPRVKSFFITH